MKIFFLVFLLAVKGIYLGEEDKEEDREEDDFFSEEEEEKEEKKGEKKTKAKPIDKAYADYDKLYNGGHLSEEEKNIIGTPKRSIYNISHAFVTDFESIKNDKVKIWDSYEDTFNIYDISYLDRAHCPKQNFFNKFQNLGASGTLSKSFIPQIHKDISITSGYTGLDMEKENSFCNFIIDTRAPIIDFRTIYGKVNHNLDFDLKFAVNVNKNLHFGFLFKPKFQERSFGNILEKENKDKKEKRTDMNVQNIPFSTYLFYKSDNNKHLAYVNFSLFHNKIFESGGMYKSPIGFIDGFGVENNIDLKDNIETKEQFSKITGYYQYKCKNFYFYAEDNFKLSRNILNCNVDYFLKTQDDNTTKIVLKGKILQTKTLNFINDNNSYDRIANNIIKPFSTIDAFGSNSLELGIKNNTKNDKFFYRVYLKFNITKRNLTQYTFKETLKKEDIKEEKKEALIEENKEEEFKEEGKKEKKGDNKEVLIEEEFKEEGKKEKKGDNKEVLIEEEFKEDKLIKEKEEEEEEKKKKKEKEDDEIPYGELVKEETCAEPFDFQPILGVNLRFFNIDILVEVPFFNKTFECNCNFKNIIFTNNMCGRLCVSYEKEFLDTSLQLVRYPIPTIYKKYKTPYNNIETYEKNNLKNPFEAQFKINGNVTIANRATLKPYFSSLLKYNTLFFKQKDNCDCCSEPIQSEDWISHIYVGFYTRIRIAGPVFIDLDLSGNFKINLTSNHPRIVKEELNNIPHFSVYGRLYFGKDFAKGVANVTTGLEIYWNTPFHPDRYNFINQQFFQQSFLPKDKSKVVQYPIINFFFNIRFGKFEFSAKFNNLLKFFNITNYVYCSTLYYPTEREGFFFTIRYIFVD